MGSIRKVMCWSDPMEQIRLNLMSDIFLPLQVLDVSSLKGKRNSSGARLYLIEEIFKHKVVVVITGSELHILRAEHVERNFISDVKADCAVLQFRNSTHGVNGPAEIVCTLSENVSRKPTLVSTFMLRRINISPTKQKSSPENQKLLIFIFI